MVSNILRFFYNSRKFFIFLQIGKFEVPYILFLFTLNKALCNSSLLENTYMWNNNIIIWIWWQNNVDAWFIFFVFHRNCMCSYRHFFQIHQKTSRAMTSRVSIFSYCFIFYCVFFITFLLRRSLKDHKSKVLVLFKCTCLLTQYKL